MGPYEEFKYKHRRQKNKQHTHTCIPSPKGEQPVIHGGSYVILDEDLIEFYKLYSNHVFNSDGKIVAQEFLTERQISKAGPILIDLDFRYPYEIDDDIPPRQHNMGIIRDIVQLYIEKLYELIQFTPNSTFDIFIILNCDANKICFMYILL